MKITRFTGVQCRTTRELWEEVFCEDSAAFTDYYYEHKAENNIGYVVGDFPYEAMLFRTPYDVEVYGKRKQLSYIVGVATRSRHRHKGHMTALLMTAMKEMYQQKQPFTFLMPANPAIYEPFDFEYVYERTVWRFREETFPMVVLEPMVSSEKGCNLFLERKESINDFSGKNLLRAAQVRMPVKTETESTFTLRSLRGLLQGDENIEIYKELAVFANKILSNSSTIYVYRDAEYYRRQLLELTAQNGDIFIAYEKERICGFFLYAREGQEIAIQELLTEKKDMFPFIIEETEKKPVIMARLIHVEEMLKLIKSEEPRNLLLEVVDDLLPENDGVYRVEIAAQGSSVTKLKEHRTAEVVMDIKALTKKLLKNVFINEIV